MVHELRSCTIRPDRMEDCHRVFESACAPVVRAVGISMLGFWEAEPKDGRTLIDMLGFADAAAREKAWPRVQATVLTPTRSSPA